MRIGAAVVRKLGGRMTVGVGVRLPTGYLAAVVPLPPSVNNLFATVRGRRVKSRAYRAWEKAAGPFLAGLTPPAAYPVRLRLTLVGKVNESRDWDNFVKPVQDALVAVGVLVADDLRHVAGGEVWYKPGDGPAGVVVELVLADAEGRT